MPSLRLLQHHHSFQPYALLDEDVEAGEVAADGQASSASTISDQGAGQSLETVSPPDEPQGHEASARPGLSIYYVGYRCECGEPGFKI